MQIEPQHTAAKIHAWGVANKLAITEGMAEQLASQVIGIQQITGQLNSVKRQLDLAFNARAELLEALEILAKAVADTGDGKTATERIIQDQNALRYAQSMVLKHKGKQFLVIDKLQDS